MSAKMVPCPRCGKDSEFSPANPYRPFCSERCKMIDLGQWASGHDRVPTPEEENSEKQEVNDDAERDEDES